MNEQFRSATDLQSASEKKLSALEESNQKLKTENRKLQELVESHGRASLRLEERLNALEKATAMQMARK